MPTILQLATHLFLQTLVILVTYQLIWPIFRRLAQLEVVAVMVAGFLSGLSVLGLIRLGVQRWLVPAVFGPTGEEPEPVHRATPAVDVP
ncbi:hypothetical protein [Nocardia amamiensis]|uniref:hypothetical protein n=1 Tax=Nocardia amamiensis TaxID=404578 RepID=UPI0008363A60|nr:hypothetical protein [Nocardia amamiensis]